MPKAQQLLTNDPINAGQIEQMWLEAIVSKLDLKGAPEIRRDRLNDTNVTTLWHRNQPVAIAVRQRNDLNWICLTMTEFEPMVADLSLAGS